MRKSAILNLALAVSAVVSVAAGILAETSSPRPFDQPDREQDLARRGLEISPVTLNLTGKDATLVGLGSFIINAQSSCNDCHSAGPMTQYLPGGNPFFGQKPAKTNPATYLGGGRDFGPLLPNSPHIISRNLTPDRNGQTLGGDTFQEFLTLMRTGVDPDHVHPPCTVISTTPCLPPPFDGNLLQI